MRKVILLPLLTLLSAYALPAQSLRIQGTVFDGDNLTPLPLVNVSAANSEGSTNPEGFFDLRIPGQPELVVLTFYKPGFSLLERTVLPDGRNEILLDTIYLLHPVTNVKDVVTDEDRIPIITLSGDSDGELEGGQNISGILSASTDPFINAASFNLSNGGFDIRGYSQESIVLFNGMPFNSVESDAVFWSTWGGLNDVTRNRLSTFDLSPVAFSFGGVGGAIAFDTRASEQRRQKRLSYMFSNRTYSGRLMGTWSTGMGKNGWAFSFSGSRRWAQEGYVPGTFYDAWSYFASVDKKLGAHHLLNLTFLGAPTKRGAQSNSIQQVNDLAGTNFYNPNWGWQQGEKRNARVVNTHQPLLTLRHDWRPSSRTTLTTAVGFLFGRYGRTALDWFIAPDPRPDYYRNTPLFLATENAAAADDVAALYQAQPDLLQIQWDKLYTANREHGQSYQGLPGIWSQYIVSDQRSDTRRLNASATLQHAFNSRLSLQTGLTAYRERIHYFRTVDDLLGGDYYLNIDRFALENPIAGQQPGFNLLSEEVVVREGDTYGYNYDIQGRRYTAWTQVQLKRNRFDFFLAGELSRTEFWREGYYRNGRFPDNSFGISPTQSYTNAGAKGGVTFKLNGRNYLYANAAFLNRAPDSRNAYASPRLRDQLVPGLTEEQVRAFEAGYQLRAPGIKARATFFHTQFDNGLRLSRFFLPGDLTRFGTYLLTGLDRRHAGVEAAVEAKLGPSLTLRGAGCIGEYIFTSRPNGIFVQDDDGVIRDRGTIYLKNFYVPNSPQTAGSLGLEYRAPKFWSASVTVNYFDRNYLDVSPERRTADMVFGLPDDGDLFREIITQSEAPDAFTVDLFANKSFKVDDLFLYLTAGVTNLLNASVVTGGFEQLRFERAQVEQTGINVFPERRFYAFGTNFFLMGAIRF